MPAACLSVRLNIESGTHLHRCKCSSMTAAACAASGCPCVYRSDNVRSSCVALALVLGSVDTGIVGWLTIKLPISGSRSQTLAG